jgi:uncharacterized protein YyaL (SSP411 family)
MSRHIRLSSRSLGLCLAGGLLGCQPSADIAPEPSPAPAVSVTNTASVQPEHRHTNRLANEPSPYLRQHMHNPVDWYPWGEEAFEKARKENKPILLSIGYSTCHWCHVMERESFENEAIAAFLNEHFVSIKVDREERPDVDKIYMTFVQATTGGGGWPLNVFLTPDRKPFFGGTYFPAEPKYGRQTTFPNLLKQIADVWADADKHQRLVAGSLEQFEQLRGHVTTEKPVDVTLSTQALTNALERFKSMYEPRHGGFGQQPKFPRPALPRFVLAQGVKQNDPLAIEMVLNTCDKMAAGGIHDHLGGGFARYSVDAQWLVPHFEKMLYDNAQLTQLYLDAWLVGDRPAHAETAHGIIRYVLRDMTHPDGGFFSAEDADSEGQEGKFYCWTTDQLKAALTAAEYAIVERHYGITAEGNFEDHSHPEPLKHLNVLSIVDPKLTTAESELLAAANGKLFALRAKRVRPGLDDKVLASWNGLMLGAIARAAVVLNEPAYLAAAEKNLAFIQAKLWDAKTKTLYHRWREGERDDVQLLDAYSSMLDGTLHLYEATLKPAHLQFAIDLAESMMARFQDAKDGGFFQSAGDDSLLLRLKEDYDGAEPSGNSVAALALLKLGKITDRKDFTQAATGTLELFARNLETQPQSVPCLITALDFLLHEPYRLVVAGDAESMVARQLITSAHGVFQPNKVLLGSDGPVEAFAKTLKPDQGVMAFLCAGTFCHPPTGDPARVAGLLKAGK